MQFSYWKVNLLLGFQSPYCSMEIKETVLACEETTINAELHWNQLPVPAPHSYHCSVNKDSLSVCYALEHALKYNSEIMETTL